MILLLYFLLGSLILAGAWWVAVIHRAPDQMQSVAGAGLVLSVITLLWVCQFIRLTFRYFAS